MTTKYDQPDYLLRGTFRFITPPKSPPTQSPCFSHFLSPIQALRDVEKGDSSEVLSARQKRALKGVLKARRKGANGGRAGGSAGGSAEGVKLFLALLKMCPAFVLKWTEQRPFYLVKDWLPLLSQAKGFLSEGDQGDIEEEVVAGGVLTEQQMGFMTALAARFGDTNAMYQLAANDLRQWHSRHPPIDPQVKGKDRNTSDKGEAKEDDEERNKDADEGILNSLLITLAVR